MTTTGSAVCREVEMLLPWYGGRGLGEAADLLITAHLAECPACRRELAVDAALRVSVKRAIEALPAPATPPRDIAAELAGVLAERAAIGLLRSLPVVGDALAAALSGR